MKNDNMLTFEMMGGFKAIRNEDDPDKMDMGYFMFSITDLVAERMDQDYLGYKINQLFTEELERAMARIDKDAKMVVRGCKHEPS